MTLRAIIDAVAILNEAIVHSQTLDDGTRFTVARDPTPVQFHSMMNNSKKHDMRMICRAGHIYCWDAYYGDHDIVGHYLLGFTGGPSDIGARLQVTPAYIEYGNKQIDIDLRGLDDSSEWRDAVRDTARGKIGETIANLLREYPRLERLAAKLQVAVHCVVTWRDNRKSDIQYMEIGALDSFKA